MTFHFNSEKERNEWYYSIAHNYNSASTKRRDEVVEMITTLGAYLTISFAKYEWDKIIDALYTP